MWRCSNQSIELGQKSVLAVVEIPLSITAFWWFASQSEWPWLTLCAFLAVPALLLRSLAADMLEIEKMERLAQQMEQDMHNYPVSASWPVGVAVGGGLGAVCYLLAEASLSGQRGWMLYLGASGMGLIAISLSIAGSFMTATTARSFGIALAVCLASTIIAVFIVAGAMSALCVVVGVIVLLIALYFEGLHTDNRGEAVLTLIGVGVQPISLKIFVFPSQLVARIVCWREGLLSYEHNCRTAIVVIDMWRGVAGPWPLTAPSLLHDESGKYWHPLPTRIALTIAHALSVVSSALLNACYRINIKANAWLWGGIAFAFSETLWLGEQSRARTAFWATAGMVRTLGVILVGIVAWLFLPLLPPHFPLLTSETVRILHSYFQPPQFGVRYLITILLWGGLAMTWFAAYDLRAAHAKALEGAGDYRAYGPELQIHFDNKAITLRRWLKINTALAIIAAWSYSFSFALSTWPTRFSYAAWGFVKPWL